MKNSKEFQAGMKVVNKCFSFAKKSGLDCKLLKNSTCDYRLIVEGDLITGGARFIFIEARIIFNIISMKIGEDMSAKIKEHVNMRNNLIIKYYAKKYGISDAIMKFGSDAINVLGNSFDDNEKYQTSNPPSHHNCRCCP